MREKGQVKWFNEKKGFGFIVNEQGQDIFVHFNNIKGEGYRSLNDGSTVTYVLAEGEKGYKALDVEVVHEGA